ncbi:hypothetical protein RRV45_21185 [Bacillus sp. DTU_2020_1000418_1_SI_GHA_SEK_038]|uniref:hypothetical protein n=1 Tax=Bacillus sp. DTU_2020_1000418_1_SI_GHA_SEK_038 TaxID=3077585 RepID=UPI0028EE4BDE|nr:hypothetical protein [Bacillus sp. DTU_2020_1000418_1_SI_GHA_SEK_038]WNS75350.1 hypothetical protein RRV45_21185 [Bacillus sp. DTU_2020_1000418_1_SI_GHA_SEK_038]
MDYRYYPYSFPYNVEPYAIDDRIFPGGGFGPPGYPPGGFPPGQQPGFPPGQQPGFPPGQQPGFPPGQQGGPPSSPPPSFTPQMQQFTTFAVDPGGIRGCLFRYTYIWLENGRSFWFYPVFVGRNSVAGWRWRRNRWVYYGTDLRSIRSFQCF